ncbi:ABC transporter substrate-binding protein [Paenibacillus thiaminolyticus]|uniref:ABC transporter substrate-binding protein n=1 Tax=Paenibacillus thiaminolyticus TaxID=49283 RepID=UPI0025430640|nr:ABC transporter substrate-binding protein [Paenibacillus thiaminolyticus]WII36179.1 ABC transporter substrate-binding protein [Paenibacillus thiaminolyticus]
MMKRLISVTLILVLALIFTGCGQKEGQATSSQESAAQQNEKAAEEQKSEDHQTEQQKAESTQEAGFKVVNTSRGEMKIPVNPQRVVDLAYATEELLTMGIKPIISSAGPDLPDYLKDKLEGVTLVDAGYVKVEDVMALDPDLIITSGRTEKLYDQLTQIAPTVQLEGDFYTWRKRFPEMPGILGKEKEMNEWLAQYEEKAKKIGDEMKGVTGDATFTLYVTNASQYRIY